MSLYIGVDFGAKRTGIAVSDPTFLIASAHGTYATEEVLSELKNLAQQASIVGFVIGQPKRWSGEASTVEESILSWIQSLTSEFPNIPIHREDERFTSKIAQQSLVMGGVKKSKRKDKKMLDSVSATLILQSFLDRLNNSL